MTDHVKITRRFAATPEQVFDAWLDPATARKWLAGDEPNSSYSAEIDAQPGGAWVMTARSDKGVHIWGGEYLEIERPRRLVLTFAYPINSPHRNRVTVELESDGDGTLLTLVHENVSGGGGAVTEGWNGFIDALTSVVEQREYLRELRLTREFAATPGQVYEAWTNPELARNWLFTLPTTNKNFEMDARPGGKWSITDHRDGTDYTAVGEFLAVEPPHRIVFTFGMPQYSPEFDRVSVKLDPRGNGCVMIFLQEANWPEEEVELYKTEMTKGWGIMFNNLATLLLQDEDKNTGDLENG